MTPALFRREELTDCEAASCSINEEIGQKSSKSGFLISAVVYKQAGKAAVSHDLAFELQDTRILALYKN